MASPFASLFNNRQKMSEWYTWEKPHVYGDRNDPGTLKPGFISSQFEMGGYGKPVYKEDPEYTQRWHNNPGRGTNRYVSELTSPGLYIYKDPNYRAPAPPPPPQAQAPATATSTPFDDRLGDIKASHDDTTRSLIDQINNQQASYDAAMKDFMNLMNSRFEKLSGDYNNQLSTISSTLGGQIESLMSQIASYQKSYNPTTVVGTSAKATAFDVPESTAGQLGIKNKGTSQFNRDVRKNLKISGVQL